MANFPATISPSSPVEVETRKNVSLTQSETSVRQFVIHSYAFRFFKLKFNKREIEELNEMLALWELVQPGELTWTNTDCDVNSDVFETDSDLTWRGIDNNVYDYQLSLKAKNPISHPIPSSNVLTFDPSYGFDASTGKIINISESEAMRRKAADTSDEKRHYGLVFTEWSLSQTLLAEGLWDYHYPGRAIEFTDPQLGDTSDYTIDSNFKWLIHDWDWIDFSFAIHEL